MPQSIAEQISYLKNPSLVVSSVVESDAQVMASQGEGDCCPQQLWLPITPFVLSVRSQELPRSTSPHAEGKNHIKVNYVYRCSKQEVYASKIQN